MVISGIPVNPPEKPIPEGVSFMILFGLKLAGGNKSRFQTRKKGCKKKGDDKNNPVIHTKLFVSDIHRLQIVHAGQ